MKNPCRNCLVLPVCLSKDPNIVPHQCSKIMTYLSRKIKRVVAKRYGADIKVFIHHIYVEELNVWYRIVSDKNQRISSLFDISYHHHFSGEEKVYNSKSLT
jgi:hypothetical protein